MKKGTRTRDLKQKTIDKHLYESERKKHWQHHFITSALQFVYVNGK